MNNKSLEFINKKFSNLRGLWIGKKKTYLLPHELAFESDTPTTISSIVKDAYLQIEYNHSIETVKHEGLLIISFSTKTKEVRASWLDNFHTGEDMMHFLGEIDHGKIILNGGYEVNGNIWKWIIEIDYIQKDDMIIIQHFNVPSGSERYLGVDIKLSRLYMD